MRDMPVSVTVGSSFGVFAYANESEPPRSKSVGTYGIYFGVSFPSGRHALPVSREPVNQIL